jgi:hypothetical protein
MADYPTLRSANVARQAEWDTGNQIGATWRGNEMGGEIGEALEKGVALIEMGVAGGRAQNIIKKLERERLNIPGSRATIEELMDELADVVICADLVAMLYGGDLDAAVARKFNATSEKVGLQTRLSAPTPGLLEAAQALGVIGDGYCFCASNRDPHKAKHEPECRDLRTAMGEVDF